MDEFFSDYLSASKESCGDFDKYNLNAFLCRGRFENNLAQWTMRVCDFLVDRLGWSREIHISHFFLVLDTANNDALYPDGQRM